MAEIPIISEQPNQEGVYPVNWFWMPETDDGKPGYVGTPGTETLKTILAGVEIRGMEE